MRQLIGLLLMLVLVRHPAAAFEVVPASLWGGEQAAAAQAEDGAGKDGPVDATVTAPEDAGAGDADRGGAPESASQTDDGGYPTIVAIVFEGNRVTRPKTMLREMVVKPGDPADPSKIERSRQGVLDLGLFHRVDVRSEPVDGGVRLVFRVDERYYLFPVPRVDVKSDGRYAYGAQLRWANVAGLNHSIDVIFKRENQQQQGVGEENNTIANYSAPFIFDTPYRLSLGGQYRTRPVDGPLGSYQESFRNLFAGLSRTFSTGPASYGLSIGGGLNWQQEQTDGPFAERAYGTAIAPRLTIGSKNYHYRIYSETGSSWGLLLEVADHRAGSDYDYSKWEASAARYIDVGSKAHQTLNLKGRLGAYFSGPDRLDDVYALGGADLLRAYNNNYVEGNGYYYGAIEFARPIGPNYIRGVVMLEFGNAAARPEDLRLDRVYSDLAIAVRLRLPKFVNFEVEIGYAYPLDTPGSGRVFAGRL